MKEIIRKPLLKSVIGDRCLTIFAVFTLIINHVHSQIRVQMETPEELRNGTLFGNLRTKLVQTGHYTQTGLATGYQQQFLPDNSYVKIDPHNGNLNIKSRIDREDICEDEAVQDCRLALNVAQKGPQGSMQFIMIDLKIIDINDNAPSWQLRYIPLNIPEHSDVGTKFALPTATDIDHGPINTTVRYGIRKQSDSEAFTLETNLIPTGENVPRKFKLYLKINKDLDREVLDFYQVELFAIDGGTPSLTGSVTINITILDINDQVPVFLTKNPMISVPENSPVNKKIFQLKATDMDPLDLKRLRYEIGSSAGKSLREMFSIDKISGAIFVTGNLDFEKKAQYNVPVTVSDGKHIVDTMVTVDVTNLNDNSPLISIQTFSDSSSELSVMENQDAGFFIASVTVTDGDDKLGTEPIHCQVDKANFEVRPLFEGSTSQFKLLTKTSFDRENQTEYYSTIECFDNGKPAKSSSQSFRVKILDVNDNPPVFPSQHMTKEVEENAPAGTLVYRADAKDQDYGENAKIRYSLDSLSTEFFSIDEKTGDIKTRVVFDREQRARFDISVIAVDRGFSPTISPNDAMSISSEKYRSNTVQGSLTVIIKDVNDCQPVFEQPTYHFSVEEDQKANRKIGNVNAHDGDVSQPNNVIHFFMKHEDGNKAMLDFRVSPRGQIFVARDGIDRETTPSYSFYIVARDEGNPSLSSSVNVQIQILDVNDNQPQWIFPSDSNKSINITYRSPVGHRVTQLSALDRDEGVNAEVHYFILQSKSSLFELDSATGAIYVAKTMTVSDLGMLKMVVEARDRGTPPQYNHRVLDVNIVTQLVTNSNRYGRLEGDLVIIVVMVAITLVISMVLIAAILFLRCRSCPFGARFKRVRGGRMYSPDGHSASPVHEMLSTFHPSHTLSSYMAQSMESDRTFNFVRDGSKFLYDIDSESLDSGRGCSSDTTINGGKKVETAVTRKPQYSTALRYGDPHALKEWTNESKQRSTDMTNPRAPNSGTFTSNPSNNAVSRRPAATAAADDRPSNTAGSRVRLSVTFVEPEYQTCHPPQQQEGGEDTGGGNSRDSDGEEERYGHLNQTGGGGGGVALMMSPSASCNADLMMLAAGRSTFDPDGGRTYTQLSGPGRVTSPNLYTKLPASFV